MTMAIPMNIVTQNHLKLNRAHFSDFFSDFSILVSYLLNFRRKKLNLQDFVQDIPGWPKENIVFKDIAPLLKDHNAFSDAINKMHPPIERVDYWVGIESRGFMFAGALAQKFGGGMIMMRKKGKLPPPIVTHNYGLEYGTDTLEINKGTGNVVIVDDVLATGGTLKAANTLCEQAGYTVLGFSTLIDLTYIHQQAPFYIENKLVHTVLKYHEISNLVYDLA